MTIPAAGRCTAVLAALLAIAAMFVYPGGDGYHHDTARYSFFHNYLSDLGSSTTRSGAANSTGAWLFVACLVAAAIALCACLAGLWQIHTSSAAARPWATAACLAGAMSGISIVAVSLTPMDVNLHLHESLSNGAIIPLPAVTLLLGIAALRDHRLPRRSVAGWVVLLTILGLYVAVLFWHPGFGTERGHIIQVTGQKLAVLAALIIVPYQSWAAERAASNSQLQVQVQVIPAGEK
jgi:hypothetical membrane protein